MQTFVKSLYTQAALLGTSRRVFPKMAAQRMSMVQNSARAFATDIEVKKKEESAIDIDSKNKRLGVDTLFSEQKHAYVLTFPWNF